MAIDQNKIAAYRTTYKRLTLVAPNRLTVCTFFAGFTLTAFVGLFTLLPAIDELKIGSIIILLADLCLGAATLLFIFTAMATYVTMQRLANLSPEAVAVLLDDSQEQIAPPSSDAEQLNECRRLYDEPAPFIVWGLLLIVIGMVLVTWHIYLPLAIIFLLVLSTIVLRMKTLHRIMRRVLIGRRIS